MKRFHTEDKSVSWGNSLGIDTVPLSNLTTAMPAVMTTNTTARPTDKADVYLNESSEEKRKIRYINKSLSFEALSIR